MSLPPGRAAAPLLTVAAFLLGPIGFLAPLGLAPLLIVVALGLAAIAVLERRLPAPPIDLAVGLTLLCTLGLSSVVWAIDPQQTMVRALRLVGECIEGVLLVDAASRLDATERRRILTGLALGLAVMIALAFTDAWLGRGLMRWLHGPLTPPTASNRGATVLALMMWPALVFLARTRGRWVALGGWALAASGIAVGLAASAHLALAVASVTFLAALRLRSAAARILLVAAPALVLAMPLVPLLTPPDQPLLPRAMIKPSAMHRLVIWHFTDTRIAEKPLLGWGLDAARAMPGGKEFRILPNPSSQVERYEQMPLHPHNGALQVWLELGGVGALIGALIVLVVLSRLTPATLAPAARAAGLASFMAAAIEVSLSYGIWQSWWIAALWFASFAVLLVRDEPPAASAIPAP
jgi:exopolysaccharide production protein ExoQ